MLTTSLAPYLHWAKTRTPAAIDLAGSTLLACSLDDLPGARDAVDLSAPNDNGYPPLIGAIARHYGIANDRVMTAQGCAGANFLAITALVGAGDDVLIERPTYDPLIGVCRLLGANVIRFDRRFDDGYGLDLADIASKLTARTRLIIVTTPHNPSGVILGQDSLLALGRLAAGVGAHVLADEVYLDVANLVRTSVEATPTVARLDGPFISTNSLTKSYGLSGLRCGWALAPAPIVERMRRTRDLADGQGTGPSERLAVLAFFELARLAERSRRLLRTNLGLARDFLRAHPMLEVAEPPASSVTFPRISDVADAEAFIQRLLDEEGVAVAPGRFFEAPAHFRVSLAGPTDALERGLTKIGHVLHRL